MNYGNRSEELIQQAMSAYGSLEDGMKEKGSMKLEDFLQSAIGASSSKTTKIPEAQASVRPEAAAVAPVPAAQVNHAQAAIPTDAPVDEAEIEKLRAFLRSMVEFKASDVFIEAGLPLTYRADGHQYRQSSAPLKPMTSLSPSPVWGASVRTSSAKGVPWALLFASSPSSCRIPLTTTSLTASCASRTCRRGSCWSRGLQVRASHLPWPA